MGRNGSRRYLAPNRKLQELRVNAGMSPNDLGWRAGVSGKTIRYAEAGHTPSPRVQFAIAEIFGLLPTDLWPLHESRRQRVSA